MIDCPVRQAHPEGFWCDGCQTGLWVLWLSPSRPYALTWTRTSTRPWKLLFIWRCVIELSHSKSFTDSANLDIVFINKSWLNEDIPKIATCLAEYQSIRCRRNGYRGGGFLGYIGQSLLTSGMYPTLELIKVSPYAFYMIIIYCPRGTTEFGLTCKRMHLAILSSFYRRPKLLPWTLTSPDCADIRLWH